MEQTTNLKLPLINVNNAEDLKKTFIDYVKMISGVDDSSALQILDRVIKDLQTTKQDTLTAGENITIVDNVISGQGGVEEEDVMEIIENNAEQTNTLDVGTSATFDATSDEQIPTSKAVSDLMASAGGGSGGSKLYIHNIVSEYKTVDPTGRICLTLINDSAEVLDKWSKVGLALYNLGHTSEAKGKMCNGIIVIKNSDGVITKIRNIVNVFGSSSGGMQGSVYVTELEQNEDGKNVITKITSTSSVPSPNIVSDTVIEL